MNYKINGCCGQKGCFGRKYFSCNFYESCEYQHQCKQESELYKVKKCKRKIFDLKEKYGLDVVKNATEQFLKEISDGR